MDEKHTYYVSVARGEILRSGTDSPYEFLVNATDDEITKLRQLFDANDEVGWDNFYRAHVPYVQYHIDEENRAGDSLLIQIYSFIHEIGDEAAVKHIESMGILPKENESKDRPPYIPRAHDQSAQPESS
ncbi:hypothetical protein [Jeotgalibacillus soli]|uniref:Hydrolase n=1 Tax=Jeotgalibacillus soli TaxID=889306 RepID=A0A0C2RQB6_9BACL|nr:hypothetical protein [Jeotgalibacillus soli]KIL43939.1 hydrolase [Jeotgalibacillus soli]